MVRSDTPLTVVDLGKMVIKLSTRLIPLSKELWDNYEKNYTSFKLRDFFQDVNMNLTSYLEVLSDLYIMGDNTRRLRQLSKFHMYLVWVNDNARKVESPDYYIGGYQQI